jgi:hypothetical protein
MSIFCDMAGDFLKVKLHGFGVGVWQGKASAFPLGRTNGAEEIGISIALVGGLSWSCAAPGPLPHDAVLLTDARLILKPDFDCCAGFQFTQMAAQGRAEVFLKAAIVSASWPGCRGLGLM